MSCPYEIVCSQKVRKECILYPYRVGECHSSCQYRSGEGCNMPLGRICDVASPCHRLVNRLPKHLLERLKQ
jgi:hypothetical protein